MLLTPVVLSISVQLDLPAMPFALQTVWLANTASLLLPVSNLTNLLALDRLGLRPHEFAARRWLPAVVAAALTVACSGCWSAPTSGMVLLWGSLATLLWRERCRARAVEVSARQFATLGLVGVAIVLVATTLALTVTGT